MKKMILIVSIILGFMGGQAAFCSAPAPKVTPASRADIDVTPVKHITRQNIIMDHRMILSFIKTHPLELLCHCVNIAMENFGENNEMIDPDMHDFFYDRRFFNNDHYKKYFDIYNSICPEEKEIIHYQMTEDEESGTKKIVVHEGVFPNEIGVIGEVEYTIFDFHEMRPEIKVLSVDARYRNQGIARELMQRAIADLHGMMKAPQAIHLFAFPCKNASDNKGDERIKPPLTFEQLIAFYQKIGALLIKKNTITAQMEIPYPHHKK